jgi:hypothetical protein
MLLSGFVVLQLKSNVETVCDLARVSKPLRQIPVCQTPDPQVPTPHPNSRQILRIFSAAELSTQAFIISFTQFDNTPQMKR